MSSLYSSNSARFWSQRAGAKAIASTSRSFGLPRKSWMSRSTPEHLRVRWATLHAPPVQDSNVKRRQSALISRQTLVRKTCRNLIVWLKLSAAQARRIAVNACSTTGTPPGPAATSTVATTTTSLSALSRARHRLGGEQRPRQRQCRHQTFRYKKNGHHPMRTRSSQTHLGSIDT